jgi:uncharacterized protein with von Willebrand factor type A (vWA) domain
MIVDRSGSMSSCKKEVIEGMNQFVAEQRKLPGKCNLTSVIFDHEYEVCYESKDLRDLGYMDDSSYVPRGGTALWDAIGRTIEACKPRFAKSNPDQVICVIVTDGEENASKEFTLDRIRKYVDELSWKFVFIGANQDAVLTAKAMNMPQNLAGTYDATPKGTKQAYRGMTAAVSCLRSGNEVSGMICDTPAEPKTNAP